MYKILIEIANCYDVLKELVRTIYALLDVLVRKNIITYEEYNEIKRRGENKCTSTNYSTTLYC